MEGGGGNKKGKKGGNSKVRERERERGGDAQWHSTAAPGRPMPEQMDIPKGTVVSPHRTTFS